MIWLFAFALAIAAAPFIREALRMPVASRRTAMPGRLIALTNGATHVIESGPSDGKPIILVHGLTTPAFVFDALARDLSGDGHRVIAYDHYGRGFSDRPSGLQDSAFYNDHLIELMTALEITAPVILIGYSMGGAIVSDFAARYPDKVANAILIAPAGMQLDLGPLIRRVVAWPILGDWLMYAQFARAHIKGSEAERNLPSAIPNIVDLQQDELTYRGFIPAVLSSLRGILARPQEDAHKAMHRQKTRVTAIWGAEDAVIPITCKDTLTQWNPDSAHTVIAQAGHGVTYTHASDLNAAVKRALSRDGRHPPFFDG